MPNFTTARRAVSEEIGNGGFVTLNYYIDEPMTKGLERVLAICFAKEFSFQSIIKHYEGL